LVQAQQLRQRQHISDAAQHNMPEPAQNGSRRHLLLTPPQMQLAFSKNSRQDHISAVLVF
jgi:hypothetical protein